jgi:dipicolinate synthase subunit A
MKSEKVFLIAGGDSRQIYLAEKLSQKYNVKFTGFELYKNIEDKNMMFSEIPDNYADFLVLPVIVSNDGAYLNAPYSENKISVSAFANKIKYGGTVFCGKISQYDATVFNNAGIKVKKYSECELFSIKNAFATAEGALQVAMQNSDRMICSQKILVTGFGRISKALVKILNGIGADVTVSARKASDIIWAENYGCKTFFINELDKKSMGFDIVFNTVPDVIFTDKVLECMDKNTLLIDLASKPGGVDFDYAKSVGIKTIHALSLPSKAVPISAGFIIADTIKFMMNSEGRNEFD